MLNRKAYLTIYCPCYEKFEFNFLKNTIILKVVLTFVGKFIALDNHNTNSIKDDIANIYLDIIKYKHFINVSNININIYYFTLLFGINYRYNTHS